MQNVFRYGIAALSLALLLGLSGLARYLDLSINFTIPLVVTIVAVAWFLGRGPGFFLSVLIAIAAVFTNRRNPEQSTALYAFGLLSALSLLIFVVWLVSVVKASRQRAKEQSDLFRTTLASIGDAVIVSDRNGIVTFMNPTAQQLLGEEVTADDKKHLRDVYQPIDESTGEPLGDLFQRIDETHEVVTLTTNIALDRSDGTRLPITDTCSPIIDSEGKLRGAVIVFQDDTERRRAANALMETEHRRQQSQKLEAIGTLTGGVAHDFNNLLTAILGYTQLAMRKIDPLSPAFDNLVNVENAGNRAAELTKKLLAFSRRQKLEVRTIDLNESVKDMLRLLERVIPANVKITFNPQSGLDLIRADPTAIEQVIMNLSVNARDAMPKGGLIAIETRSVELDEFYCKQFPGCVPGSYAQILVSDTGSGMDQETLNRIFEPFFTTKEVDKGTGLGLSIVYGIVRQHSGHINVYSEPGKGTTFKVYFPMETSPVDAPAKAELRRSLSGTETVLVADDETALLSLSKEVLETLGYRVIAAENGERAVELYKEHSDEIDLLLLDVVMPVTGGIEAYNAIREMSEREPRVIFMTGYSNEIFDHNDLLEEAPDNVIQKPYTLDALGLAVRSALSAR